VLTRLVFDDGAAHLCGGKVVDETRRNKSARADPDIEVEVVEIDPVEGLIESADGADFVDGSFGATTGQGEADLGYATGRIDHS
jgi:hypothetical protein